MAVPRLAQSLSSIIDIVREEPDTAIEVKIDSWIWSSYDGRISSHRRNCLLVEVLGPHEVCNDIC